MKKARFFILGLMFLIYVILFGSIAHSSAKLWTDIIFGDITNANPIALIWSSAFFYCFMALIFVLPGIGILAFNLQIEDDRVSI